MEENVKILIVEDESIVAFDLQRLLLNLGYDVLDIVSSGEKAIRKVTEEKPDLIIMDIMLNGALNGIQTAGKIREITDVAIIYLTAYADTDTLKNAKITEPYGYILKPFDEKVLLSTIEMALYKNKMEKKLRASEKKYRELAAELKDLNEKKDQFYSILSFNLRDPLDSIMGFSEILKNEYKELSNEDIQLFILSIYQSSKQIYNLLNNLVQFSRVQIKDLDFNPRPLNLHSQVDEIINTMQSAGDQKGIKLINYVNKDISVSADKNMLRIILNNILDNSIKYSNEGSAVDISAKAENWRVKIEIEDRGVGIDENLLKNIFELNVKKTTPGTNNEMGTGLGLLLAKEFVEKNRGNIEIKSKKNKGTCVTFTLPSKNSAA